MKYGLIYRWNWTIDLTPKIQAVEIKRIADRMKLDSTQIASAKNGEWQWVFNVLWVTIAY